MNRSFIVNKTIEYVCGIYALLGFLSIFVSFEGIFSPDEKLLIKIAISILFLFIIFFIIAVGMMFYCYFKHRIPIICANNGNKLYIQYGDLFGETEVINSNERRNIVIPVNRCFDTTVDNIIISEKTLHGQALARLYKKSIYTEKTLNEMLDNLLAQKNYVALNEISKPSGKTKRYDIGTTIDLPCNEKEHYLLWALSTFDSSLKAHTTIEEYTLAVQRLIEACNNESEGFPVLIPLVGSGLSRIYKNQSDILDYLIKAFSLNKDKINCDIHIIIKEDLKNDISIMKYK